MPMISVRVYNLGHGLKTFRLGEDFSSTVLATGRVFRVPTQQPWALNSRTCTVSCPPPFLVTELDGCDKNNPWSATSLIH
jgi:hypothetical protein